MSRRWTILLWAAAAVALLLLGLLLPPPPWRGAGEDKAREPDRAHPAIVRERQGQGCTGEEP